MSEGESARTMMEFMRASMEHQQRMEALAPEVGERVIGKTDA